MLTLPPPFLACCLALPCVVPMPRQVPPATRLAHILLAQRRPTKILPEDWTTSTGFLAHPPSIGHVLVGVGAAIVCVVTACGRQAREINVSMIQMPLFVPGIQRLQALRELMPFGMLGGKLQENSIVSKTTAPATSGAAVSVRQALVLTKPTRLDV